MHWDVACVLVHHAHVTAHTLAYQELNKKCDLLHASTLSNARQFYSSNRFFTHQFFSTRKYFIFVTCIAINAMVLEGTFFQSSRHFCRPKFSSYPHTASPSSTTNQLLLKDSVDLEFQCICNEKLSPPHKHKECGSCPLPFRSWEHFQVKFA
jgi:hypothetical protein